MIFGQCEDETTNKPLDGSDRDHAEPDHSLFPYFVYRVCFPGPLSSASSTSSSK